MARRKQEEEEAKRRRRLVGEARIDLRITETPKRQTERRCLSKRGREGPRSFQRPANENGAWRERKGEGARHGREGEIQRKVSDEGETLLSDVPTCQSLTGGFQRARSATRHQ